MIRKKIVITFLLSLFLPLPISGETLPESDGSSTAQSDQYSYNNSGYESEIQSQSYSFPNDNLTRTPSLIGREVVAIATAPIRMKPPRGYFRLPGRILSKAVPDRQYVVCDYEIFQYLFSTQTWVELGDNGNCVGWSYWGEVADPHKSVNFDLVPPDNN